MIYAVNKRTKEHRVVNDSEAEYLSEPDYYPDNGAIVKQPSQWRIIQADADGWIEWRGGGCPLPDGSKYDVRCRRGSEGQETNPQDDFWDTNHSDSDIIAYRPILEPQAEQVKEWGGEGLPPVGTVCEVDVDEKWQECSVIAHFRQPARMVAAFTLDVNNGSKRLDYCIEEHFRPARTDREQWVDRALYLITPAPSPKMLAEAIYDALASGELEPPARN